MKGIQKKERVFQEKILHVGGIGNIMFLYYQKKEVINNYEYNTCISGR